MIDTNELQYGKSQDGTTVVESTSRMLKFKKWFKNAVDAAQEWREEAKEDQDFYNGRQWKDTDRRVLTEAKRPVITINRIKPLLNVLSGYQRLNRYDVDFLPRTNDDMQQAQVRKGITKYILDRSHYNYEESDVFFDGVTKGLGWFEVGYKFNWEIMDGDAFVRRVSPLDIYVDPESRDKYYRDAKFIIRARWLDKEELSTQYPDHKDEIEAQATSYLTEETEISNNRLWWQQETKKVRVAECWYKKTVKKKVFVLQNGDVVSELTPEMLALQQITSTHEYVKEEIHLLTFFDNVVLEDMKSPYEHGAIPFIPFCCYYQGDDDIPAGIVRDLKDPQKEINKRRSQELHILNSIANSGWLVEEGALTREQEQSIKKNITTPGAVVTVSTGTLTGGRMQPLVSPGVNTSILNATSEASAEMITVSGINEALMGTEIPNGASGRAIELKQKQAITHIALLFDNLRFAKERIVNLLWGRRGAPGIIPQYYTDQKTFRIIGETGKPEYITINQPTQIQDELGQVITTTLNDLSVGEFDIVISDTPSTATQRSAQFWSLVDACGQLGIQGAQVLDILLDLSDVPQKEEIKERLRKQEEMQAQAQQQAAQVEQQRFQAQLELEREKKLSKSIAYKDLQLPLQLQLAAKAGIFPQEYADAFMRWSVDQYAGQMGLSVNAAPQQNKVPQISMSGLVQMPQQQNSRVQARPLTQAALQGLVEANKPVL